jgi:hypothetical protein
VSDDELARLWKAERSNPDDLRAAGLMVATHNDYMLNGKRYVFWLMTTKPGSGRGEKFAIAFVGEGETDQEALDIIRAKWAEHTDKLHHAPMCPANHYHGQRAPTYRCTCGAAKEQE